MAFFPKKAIIAGIELTSTSTKVALLKKKGNGWEVVRLEEMPRNVNPLSILPKEALLVTALSSREVLVRPLAVPLTKAKDIDAAIEFQAEPHLPFPIDKAIVQTLKVASTETSTSLTLIATKKEALTRHLEMAKEHGFEPEIVTAAPLALSALSSLFPLSDRPLLFLHIPDNAADSLSNKVTCSLVENGKLIASKAFENEKQEIKKNVLALSSLLKNKDNDTLVLLASDPYLAQDIQDLTGKTVVLPKIDAVSDEKLQKFGLAIGIAFSGTQKKCLSFRQKEFVYSGRFKRLRKPFLTYLLLCLGLGASLFALGEKVLLSKERQLLTMSRALGLNLQNRTELALKLNALQEEMEKRPDTFPLLPLIPKVSDLLAWISTDSHFNSLSIDSVNYSLVSRPTFEKRTEKYSVKVEIKFSTVDQDAATALHDFLHLATTPYIDTKKAIEWDAAKENYCVRFYLKDKTRYY